MHNNTHVGWTKLSITIIIALLISACGSLSKRDLGNEEVLWISYNASSQFSSPYSWNMVINKGAGSILLRDILTNKIYCEVTDGKTALVVEKEVLRSLPEGDKGMAVDLGATDEVEMTIVVERSLAGTRVIKIAGIPDERIKYMDIMTRVLKKVESSVRNPEAVKLLRFHDNSATKNGEEPEHN